MTREAASARLRIIATRSASAQIRAHPRRPVAAHERMRIPPGAV